MENATSLIDFSKLLTISKAAKELGISRPTIYKKIADKILHPVKVGDRQFIVREEIDALKGEVHE